MRTLLSVLCASSFAAAQAQLRSFETQQLSDVFFCEGATFGDLNRDGKADAIAGPYWYEGPDLKTRHELYTPAKFDTAGYSDNFFAFVHDFDADGWNDVLVIGFPGQKATWYENPRDASKQWIPHVVFDGVDNESPAFTDLTGDGKPELVCQHDDRLGYALVDWSHPAEPWQ
ncbi:MAG TPA: VCBS repeat-containing protein, partial [Xanthomonadales bacterium]|nr:VCBS repeat-containing protein [Xanthomonadales bacterium]